MKLCYNLIGDYMKKINSFLSKNIEKIFMVFLFFQPVIDVLTAIMLHVFKIDFTIGVILRMIFLGFMIYYLLFLNKNKDKKKSIIYIGIIFVYFILYSLNIIFTKDINCLSYEIKSLIKCFYFPILLISIYEIFSERKTKITPKLLRTLFVIYSLLVFVPNILGIGFDSYSVTKSGSIGWFYTANEISAIISILMPIFIYCILEKKNIYLNIFSLFILLYILTSMGTKGPLLSFLIIVFYYLIRYLKGIFKKKKYKSLGIVGLLFLLIFAFSILIIPKTNFYKNIVVHLEFLEVDSVSDIVTSPKVIDHFIFSQRLTFWNKTNKLYLKSNISSEFLGIGYIDNYSTDDVTMKMVEMDYVDLFYRHGIIGFIIFMIPFISVLVRIIKLYFKNPKYNDKNKIMGSYMLSVVLALVLAFLTGHVITSPSVSIFVALIFNLFYNELCKGEVK